MLFQECNTTISFGSSYHVLFSLVVTGKCRNKIKYNKIEHVLIETRAIIFIYRLMAMILQKEDLVYEFARLNNRTSIISGEHS